MSKAATNDGYATRRYLIPADVSFIAAADLDREARQRLGANDGQVAIFRPLVRSGAKLVDADTSALLRQFRRPRSIAEGIVRFAREQSVNAMDIARPAHAALRDLIRAKILVAEGTPLAADITPSLRTGQEFHGFRIRECIRCMADVDVYHATNDDHPTVVLKVWRDAANGAARAARHEANLLSAEGGSVAPRLVRDGSAVTPPFIAMEWRRGVHLLTAASDAADLLPAEWMLRRLELACSVADTYAELHARGIIHGDVHDGNVLVDRDGAITLIDFGLARAVEPGAEHPRRGGVLEYLSAEDARAELKRGPMPETTFAAEQYSLAVMLFRVITGMSYLDFQPTRAEAIRQIAYDAPRSFSAVGTIPMPAVEAALRRALEKDPGARFATVRDFAAALRAVAVASPFDRTGANGAKARPRDLSTVWAALGPDAGLTDAYPRAPTCSIAFGAAGAALAWYRRSLVSAEPRHLAMARHWVAVAQSRRRDADAFHDGTDLTRAIVGSASLHHGSLGLWFVSALVAHALADEMAAAEAVRRWGQAARSGRRGLDITLGRSGIVQSAAALIEAFEPAGWRGVPTLRRCGQNAFRSVWRDLDRVGAIGPGCTFANLGMAHGWAGFLYSALAWRAVRPVSRARDAILRRRLHELAACAEPAGRGLRWPWRDRPDPERVQHLYIGGWCNGSAGFVHLWLRAFSAYGHPDHLELAHGAAWNAWEAQDGAVESLCCGLAGRAWALLAMFRATGDAAWWTRARALAHEAAAAASVDNGLTESLYRGALGVAVLLEELEAPHAARTPGFEADGWGPIR
jgi:serine/threonine-protein kinase